MTKTEIHSFKSNGIEFVLEIIEKPNVILTKLSKKGNKRYSGGSKELAEAFIPFLEKYDSDPRPLQLVHPVSGEIATAFGDSTDSIVIIQPNPKLKCN